jgi:virginiamycin B lyase
MKLGIAAIVAALGATPLAAQQVQTVPGFADFLAVDGSSVWATNHGRVERWSRQGKQAEVKLAHPCGAMARKAGSLWVADCHDGTLNRIDLHRATITATIATGIANPKGELNVVAGAGSIWVASEDKGVIARVDPHTNQVIASITVAPSTYYLAFGYGKLWAVSGPGQVLQAIDPHTNAVVHTTALGHEPGFLAAGAQGVWVQEQGDGTVARIDPDSGDVTGRVKVGANLKWGDIDTGGGKVWLRTTDDQVFAVLDPRAPAVLRRVGAAAGSGALRYTHGGVWTTAHDQHTLTWWPHPRELAK